MVSQVQQADLLSSGVIPPASPPRCSAGGPHSSGDRPSVYLVAIGQATHGSRDQCCSQAAAQHRPEETQCGGQMRYLRRAKVVSGFRNRLVAHRCRELDLDGMGGDL